MTDKTVIYVDDMNAKFRRMIMCHLIADTETDLHWMARKIGVDRRWYQGDHYDICLAMKEKAISGVAPTVTTTITTRCMSDAWRRGWQVCRSLLCGLNSRDETALLVKEPNHD